MKKLLLTTTLLCLSMFSIHGQSTAPAVFALAPNGDGALTIPGTGAPFNVETASPIFNGTTDYALELGYNVQLNGSQYVASEPQMLQALESNYFDGASNWLTWDLFTTTADLVHDRCWMSLMVNRGAGTAFTGYWTWCGTSFSFQNYNSSANDNPTQYFSVTSAGLENITSSTGNPAQIQLNTTDSTGYPGSYTALVFERANQTKWTITNEGADADTLAISTATNQVATFSQNGVFTCEGQQTAVTTKTAAYTASPADSEIRVNCSNGPVTITLPQANATGQVYRVKKIDASTNAVTISSTGGTRINGATALQLSVQYSGVTLVDGAAGSWDTY